MADPHRGVLIAESLSVPSVVEVPSLTITRLRRERVADEVPVWTLMDFVVADADSRTLAAQLSAALSTDGGWYADFGNAAEHTVVFSGRVFRYAPGDAAARREVVEYGLSVGVPQEQLDWDE